MGQYFGKYIKTKLMHYSFHNNLTFLPNYFLMNTEFKFPVADSTFTKYIP